MNSPLPEAHWDHIDVQAVRDVSWLSIQWLNEYYASLFQPELDTVGLIFDKLAQAFGERSTSLRGMAVVCGDMAAEKGYFETRNGVAFATIAGVDLSGESLARAESIMEGYPFAGVIADANRLSLEKDSLDFAVGLHGVHHVHNLGNLFFQLNQALGRDGLLFLYEWIGPPFLQIPKRNAIATRLLLRMFTTQERTTHMGKVKGSYLQDGPKSFDPSEACNSNRLYPELKHHFEIVHEAQFGGVLYPLLEGNAPNIDMSNETVRRKVIFAVRVEKILTRVGLVRPLFCMTLARPKPISF